MLKEWHRVIKCGGCLLFTDPIIVTGPLTNEEIAIRASIGAFLFVPDGTDEQLLEDAGFAITRVEDDNAFDGQQVFLDTAACLAEEKRLSRKVFVAQKVG